MVGWVDTFDHRDKILNFSMQRKDGLQDRDFCYQEWGWEDGEKENGAVVYVGSQKGQVENLSEVRRLMR